MNTSGFSSNIPAPVTTVIKWAWLDTCILHLTDDFDVVLVPKALPLPTQLRYYLKELPLHAHTSLINQVTSVHVGIKLMKHLIVHSKHTMSWSSTIIFIQKNNSSYSVHACMVTL